MLLLHSADVAHERTRMQDSFAAYHLWHGLKQREGRAVSPPPPLIRGPSPLWRKGFRFAPINSLRSPWHHSPPALAFCQLSSAFADADRKGGDDHEAQGLHQDR